MKYSAHEVALAFNTANDKKSWTARATTRPEQGMNLVHFTSQSGLVVLTYDADSGRFSVKFNKYNAAWGDYIGSVARSLMAVLTTLKAGGLAFDAPTSPEGMEMTVTNAPGSMIYVRYAGETPPTISDAIMPELRSRIDLAGEALQLDHPGLMGQLVRDGVSVYTPSDAPGPL